jgi:hypothetical protein
MISTGCRNPLYDGAPVPTSPAPLNALSNQSIVSATASSTKLTMPYKHLHDWLAGPGLGAQIVVVDNPPPVSVDHDIVVRFSRRADQPPYGLIEDEVS